MKFAISVLLLTGPKWESQRKGHKEGEWDKRDETGDNGDGEYEYMYIR